MVDVITDVPQEQAWEHIGNEDSISTVIPFSDTEKIRALYPSSAEQGAWAKTLSDTRVAALSVEDQQISANIEEALSKVPVWFALENQARLADLVSTYESQFPVMNKTYKRDELFAATTQTRREEMLKGASVQTVKDTDSVAVRLARAGDIAALRNYSRLGGVLIGKGPTQGSTLHLKDIQWWQSDKGISISLLQPNGRSFVLGSFDSSIVNRALAYVVDGRASAATVLNAELIEREQVMMHPAIRDSLLGMQLGRADEWVFQFLDPETGISPNGVRQSILRLDAATHIYNKALFVEHSRKADRDEGQIAKLREVADDAAFAKIATMKSYDPKLVKLADTCMHESRTEEDFASCVLSENEDNAWLKQIAKASKPRTCICISNL